MPVTIRHGWRTHAREVVAAIITFAAGVAAATAGAGLAPRLVGGLLFLAGTYALLDSLVLGASWRVTESAMKIPTLASRRREIAGNSDLVVTTAGRWVASVVVAGERGTRTITVNPLVSPSDLRDWFAQISDTG